jgi:hypothetical protein
MVLGPNTSRRTIASNRTPIEWLGLIADPLLAQSAIDRLQSAAHELVLDGESYRLRQRPGITDPLDQPPVVPRTSRRLRCHPGKGTILGSSDRNRWSPS